MIRQLLGGGGGSPSKSAFQLKLSSGNGYGVTIPPHEGMHFARDVSTNVRMVVVSDSENMFIFLVNSKGGDNAYIVSGRNGYNFELLSGGPEVFLRDGPDGGINVVIQEPVGVAGMLQPNCDCDVYVQLEHEA